jgi:exopolyphosphatase/guanosine-5'-triphosphate,3'-diphosphate pyrophosphatase
VSSRSRRPRTSRPARRTTTRRAAPRLPPPLAVIDIGSNSGRVTVMQIHPNGHLDVLEDSRAPLRLAREIAQSGRIGTAAMDRTLLALRDFRAVALGAGAASILTVATSAAREAKNGDELVERARRELGLRVVVIDGIREATFAFLGAVHGLPVDNGLLFDLGGGSLEVSRFRARKLHETWTLPLGALRVSDRFLHSNPPTATELRRLRAHVAKTMRKAGIPTLLDDELLIGTGGTIRNLAKMQARLRRDPLSHIHGYILTRADVRALARRTAALAQAARGALPGLSRDRADSIAGGFVTIQAAMDFVGAKHIQASGQGLREGIALATLGTGPPPARAVRDASIAALMRRFTTYNRDVARRRTRIAERLLDILEPDSAPEVRETLRYVCTSVDVGRSVDYFDRFRSAAMILAAADLQGFTPRAVALVFATLMQADNEANHLRTLRAALLEQDGQIVRKLAILLRLADEIERRCVPGLPLAVRFHLSDAALSLDSEVLGAWRPRTLAERFERAFRRQLHILTH